MMIYTRFGTPIKIIDGDVNTGEVTIEYLDGHQDEIHFAYLKADNGLQEITEAIKATQ